ncbi:plasma membrane fusion protein PRM1 [Lasiosphaeris hirsuta]|uniref:Plasma membrane fusion protein PRM1 n=1 Tax=Lasiosphaeris hirsuta TaxID=260670 RepID=A0AA39ZXI8_9PEZI|nr:plasma membrane fusion protein PRM1 [Lasiosphaeris hirsuta]
MYYGEKSGGIPPVPPLPPNLSASSWEMVDLHDDAPKSQPKLRPYPDTDPSVTPYLGLRARLSQVWFNRWTVLLLLVLVRVILLTGSLNENLGEAKVKALSACTKVEDIGSAMASMPHYLSVGVNSLAAEGVESAVSGMVSIISMILTGVEALLLFIINMYIGTYACLIGAIIHGTLDVSVQAIEGATDKMNEAIDSIADGISDDVAKFQTLYDKFKDSILSPLLPAPEDIDLTARITDLKGIQVDSGSLLKGLSSLNKTIPTFDQAENFTKNALSIPFDLVRKEVDLKFGNYSFDKSVFPVAQKQALSFCSNNSFLNDFFISLFGIVAKAKIVFTVVIPILAVLAMVMMAYVEIRRWRRERVRAKVFTEQGYDPLDVVYIASRPITAGVGIKIVSRFSGKKNLWIRWAVAYATSLPALFVLSLAMAGFFSCFCQWTMLRAIQKEAPALAEQVGDFAADVVGTLAAVSTDWADSANDVVLGLQNDMNDELFGWVRNATTAVNDTLVTFDKEIDDAITFMFKDTVLLNTARDLVGCLVTRKIDAIEKGLTFVHDHAKVTFPLFPNDTFSQGAQDSVQGDNDLTSFLASPASVTTDEISSAVQQVITALQNNIIQEALISTALLLVYVIVVLIGVMRSLVGMAGRDRTRAEGGQRYGVEREQEAAYHPHPAAPRPSSRRSASPSPAYDDIVYAGTVPRGKTGLARYPSHARKSSHPEVEGSDR